MSKLRTLQWIGDTTGYVRLLDQTLLPGQIAFRDCRTVEEVWEAIKVLRADAATAAIPVIAVTASVMQQDRKPITDAGFDAYVGKPINLKEFLDAVRGALEGSKWAPTDRQKCSSSTTRRSTSSCWAICSP